MGGVGSGRKSVRAAVRTHKDGSAMRHKEVASKKQKSVLAAARTHKDGSAKRYKEVASKKQSNATGGLARLDGDVARPFRAENSGDSMVMSPFPSPLHSPHSHFIFTYTPELDDELWREMENELDDKLEDELDDD